MPTTQPNPRPLPQRQDQENLTVLSTWNRFSDAPNALNHHLAALAFEHLDRRAERIQRIQTREDWRQYQQHVRQTLHAIVGPFPERTPLNGRITGVSQHDGFRIEKIIFESIPGFPVTGIVFIPDGPAGRRPAILYLSGHSGPAFRAAGYMHCILNLVQKGFIVFAVDPVGQGERLGYWDKQENDSRVGGPTLEHSYPGAQCFMSGRSLARYMIWDAIRAVDYLVSREEVDPDRIGATGRSGGGTQSAYLGAFDDRIAAVAPECYLTSFRRLIETRGVQDAEQNFYHGIASGIDIADLLIARAPRPTLMVTTTRDIFSIQGAREVFAEVAPAFRALGHEQDLQMVEDDAGHTTTPRNREALHAFFQQALDLPGDPADEPTPEIAPQHLQVTETGQLATSMQRETIFSLNLAETQPALNAIDRARQDPADHLPAVRDAARELSGFRNPEDAAAAVSVLTGRWQRDDYDIEMRFIPGEGDYIIPMLAFVPRGGGPHPAVLYLNAAGKSADAAPGGPIDALARAGHLVLAPDLIGFGEMGPERPRGDSYNFKLGQAPYNHWFAAIQVGRSLTGIRAGDVIRTVNYLKSRDDVDARRIAGVARGEIAPVLLHAAAFDESIRRVALIEPLISWAELVRQEYYRPLEVPHAVAGAIGQYDLPDLAATLAPRKLLYIGIVDPQGKSANTDALDRELAVVQMAYTARDADANFAITPADPESQTRQLIRWLE